MLVLKYIVKFSVNFLFIFLFDKQFGLNLDVFQADRKFLYKLFHNLFPSAKPLHFYKYTGMPTNQNVISNS